MDTQVQMIDFETGRIGGMVAVMGVRIPHCITNLPHYAGHYVSPSSRITHPRVIPITANHDFKLSAIGQVTQAEWSPQGLRIEAILHQNAQYITFEEEGRTLPLLLLMGALYFSASFRNVRLADDGMLIEGEFFEVGITEHPGSPKGEQ